MAHSLERASLGLRPPSSRGRNKRSAMPQPAVQAPNITNRWSMSSWPNLWQAANTAAATLMALMMSLKLGSPSR